MYQLDTESLKPLLCSILDQQIIKIDPVGNNDVNYTAKVTVSENEYILKAMVRKPVNQVSASRFEKVSKIFTLLKEKGIKVPEIIYLEKTTRTIDGINIYALMIMEFLNFLPLKNVWSKMDDTQQLSFGRKFANILKSIHSIQFNRYGKEGFLQESGYSVWSEFIIDYLKKIEKRLASNTRVNADLVSKSLEVIRNNPDLISYEGPPVLTHQDLWHGNVLINPKNYDEFVLIDWEWADLLDPVMDLLWLDDLFFGNKKVISAFTDSYGLKLEKIESKQKSYNIIKSLEGAAWGFLFHNPSDEGFITFHGRLSDFIHEFEEVS